MLSSLYLSRVLSVLCSSFPLNLLSLFVATQLSRLSLFSFRICILLHGIRARELRTSAVDNNSKQKTIISGGEKKKKKMDRGMASSLLKEKLNRSNYASWSYKMHLYLILNGYWSYVDGANDSIPDVTHRDPSSWEEATSRVMYCFASSVND